MIATIQFTFLVLYESVTAFISTAFQNMSFIPEHFANRKFISKELSRKNKKRQILYIIIALLPLCLMCMLHSPNVGNDSNVYVGIYKYLRNIPLSKAIASKRFEKGYMLSMWLVSHIFHNPQWLFITTGLFYSFSLGHFLMRYSKSPGLTIILCVEMLIFDTWLCINRATMAVAILLFSFKYLIEKKPIKFILVVLVAVLFHNSAIIFLIVYPLLSIYEKNISKYGSSKKFELIIFATVILLFITFNQLLAIFASRLGESYYGSYLNSPYMNGQARLSATINSILYITLLYFPRLIGGKEIKCNRSRLDNALFVISIFNICLTILTNRSTLLARFSQLLLVFVVLQYSETISKLKNRNILTIVTIVVFWAYGLAITLLKTPAWQTTYPFTWFWQI